MNEQVTVEQLLEKLEKIACLGNGDIHGNSIGNVMAIRLIERIKQHGIAVVSKTEIAESQEPDAWMQIDINSKPTNLFFNSVPEDDYHTYTPLYTAPPPSQDVQALIGELADLRECHQNLLDSDNAQVQALIAEIDGLERIDFDEGGCDYPCSDGDNYRFDDVRAILDKWRTK